MIVRDYHGGCQPPRGRLATLFLLLQKFSFPLLNEGLAFYLLPPVGSFSDLIREPAHTQFGDLVERCRKVATVLGRRTLIVLGYSFPRYLVKRYSESRKGWSNPPSGSWTAGCCSGCLRLPNSFFMVIAVVAVLAGAFLQRAPLSSALRGVDLVYQLTGADGGGFALALVGWLVKVFLETGDELGWSSFKHVPPTTPHCSAIPKCKQYSRRAEN